MKIAGIVAEYNPLHSGHEYHIKKTRELCSPDLVVVSMSGSYCQRGIPAFFDKFSRTAEALRAGADIVIELPVSVSTGSAEIFARGAVSALASMGCNVLSFGSECGDIDALKKAAGLLREEPEEMKRQIKTYLSQGLSYPAALDKAAGLSGLLSFPNNTLGIEYLKAIKDLAPAMDAVCIKRLGMDYNDGAKNYYNKNASAFNDTSAPAPFPSSSYLRSRLSEDSSAKFLENDDFSSVLFNKLLELQRDGNDFTAYADISADLADRIKGLLSEPFSFTELSDRLKAKNFTMARINRCLWHMILGITSSDYEKVRSQSFPPYIRVLGIRPEAGRYLKEIKEKKLAEGRQNTVIINSFAADRLLLSLSCRSDFERDIYAYRLYRQVYYNKYRLTLPDDYFGMLVSKRK